MLKLRPIAYSEPSPRGRPPGADPQLLELRGRPLVPAERLGVAVEVHQQVVLDQLGDLGQPHQVGRVVRQDARRVLRDDRELVLADVPRDVRVLLGELVGERLRQREAGLEVAVERDRLPCRRSGSLRGRRPCPMPGDLEPSPPARRRPAASVPTSARTAEPGPAGARTRRDIASPRCLWTSGPQRAPLPVAKSD